MTTLAPTEVAPNLTVTSAQDGVANSATVTAFADGVGHGDDEWAFGEFVRLHVAGGAAAADTVAGYLREARLFRDRFLAPHGLALAALTEDDVIAYRRELVEAGYAATTIGTKLSALRRLLDAAVRAGTLATNPATNIGAPRDRRDLGGAAARALQLSEAQALVGAVAGNSPLAVRDRALVALFLEHGPWTVELHRANLGAVDLAAGELRLRGKVRDRTIFLRADVLAVVRQLVALRLAEGRDGAALPPDVPLFVNAGRVNAGGRLSRRGIRFALDRAFSTAGFIPAATSRPRSDGTTRPLRRAAIGKRATHLAGVRVPIAHGLRATNITLARTGGAELEHIADDVGHADLRTTRKYLDRGRRRENNSALRVPLDFAATGVRGEEA
jgi:site-specific recombinase XerC